MFHRVRETSSTQDVVRAWAVAGRPHGEALLADVQTAGRGRLGRSWSCPPDAAVQLSILLRPRLPPGRVSFVTLAAAVAVRRAIGGWPERPGSGLGIKWPNDLLAPDLRKVAGILAEGEATADGFAVVLGVGVNVTAAPPLPTAACLAELGLVRERVALAEAIVDEVLAEVGRLAAAPGQVLDAWRAANVTLGRPVRVGEVEGIAASLADDGSLMVRTADGVQRVVAGDVELRG